MVMNITEERRKAKKVVEDKNFDYLIMFLICMDSVVLGLLTVDFGDLELFKILFLLDRLCMAIFIVEMLIKMYAYGPKFFKSGWNIFDLSVITISALPFASYLIILRSFRLFRLLRYFNHFKHMRNLINIMIMIIPNFFAAMLVQGGFLYVFSIMSVSLFGEVFVEFVNMGTAMLALIQTFTLDGWVSGIVRPVMTVYPYAWIFFLSFVLVSFLVVTSFFLSVISRLAQKEFKSKSCL
jgi:voltage-gated sodium channel